MTGKTLKELNVQVGDVVCYVGCFNYEVAPNRRLISVIGGITTHYSSNWSLADGFTIVSRAKKYTVWQFTDAPENVDTHSMPDGSIAWRVEFKPVVTTYKQGYKISEKNGRFTTVSELSHGATHVVEFNLIDGIPDCASVKMVKLS